MTIMLYDADEFVGSMIAFSTYFNKYHDYAEVYCGDIIFYTIEYLQPK